MVAIDSFELLPKSSISLALMANPPKESRFLVAAIRSAGIVAFEPAEEAAQPQRTAVIVEAGDAGAVAFGVLIILLGIAMIFGGATGSVDLLIKSGGFELHLATAVIGLLVLIVGAFVIKWTEPIAKFRASGKSDTTAPTVGGDAKSAK